MHEQPGLQLALVEGLFESEKVEKIRVLKQALGDGGMGFGQGGSEVRDRSSLALVGAVFDLEGESVAGPAFLNCFFGLVPVPVGREPVRGGSDARGQRDAGEVPEVGPRLVLDRRAVGDVVEVSLPGGKTITETARGPRSSSEEHQSH